MPAKTKNASARLKVGSPIADAQSVLAKLRQMGNARRREEMASRYGIVTKDAYGIRMNEMQRLAKQLGRNHELALALWDTGNYEARTVAAFVAEPDRVTPALRDRWCRDFDNWGICDTVCFKLFDQSPHAFDKIAQWAKRKDELQKRAAFALLACLALHDEHADDKTFTKLLPLIEAASTDDRNFVKKGVSWALRAIGVRSAALKSAAIALARRMAASEDSSSRWIGKDALKALT